MLGLCKTFAYRKAQFQCSRICNTSNITSLALAASDSSESGNYHVRKIVLPRESETVESLVKGTRLPAGDIVR